VTRRHNILALSIVLIVLSAYVAVEVQSALGASSGYTMNVNYQILGGGSPTAPTITYFPYGSNIATTITLTTTTQSVTMAKNKPWSVTPNPLTPSTTSEQWISTQTLSGTTPNSGSTSKTFTFQHQYKLTVTSPYDTPSGSGWYDSGKTACAQLSSTTIQGTSGTRYIFTQWTGDATGTNQKSNPITMNAPKTATASWKTQYQVTFKVNPAYSGTTTPTGTQYYDNSQTIQIKATPSANNFVAWTQTGTITITSPTTQTTTATVNGPGTITANFDITTQKPSHITIDCTPAQVDLTQIITLSGHLTDSTNHPLSGKTVFLTYTPIANSIGWTSIGQATTDKNGDYKFTWQTNLAVGSYFVMTQFAGDTTYRCSSAVASNDGTSFTVLPEYAWGGLAALGACFVGFAVFKKRNNLHL
jgi:hypothetical protein